MGGIGKTTLIKEIDAMGGMMPVVADVSSLHHRTLNQRKGRAVQGHRAQIDRQAYQDNMLRHLMNIENLVIQEGV
jgi:tRNA uridine 5-carboxymethylaminomethyl modification enzyme